MAHLKRRSAFRENRRPAFGTTQAFDTIEEFDPPSGKRRTLSTALASPRRLHTTTTLLDGSLIIAAGADSNLTQIPTAELFVRPK